MSSRRFWPTFFILLLPSFVNANWGSVLGRVAGSVRTFLGEMGSSGRTKTITNSYHETGLGAGTLSIPSYFHRIPKTFRKMACSAKSSENFRINRRNRSVFIPGSKA